MASSPAPSMEEIHQPEGLSAAYESDVVTYLELLSFMKTDQIIPFKSINDVIIPALLNNMFKGKRNSDNDIPPVQQLFDKVQRDLVDINETFKRLKEWEDRLDTLTKSLILYDWEGFCSIERTKKKVLTYLRIGEGFIDSTTTGDGLFEELATKGFIEPVEEKGIGDFKSCKINPLIRSALITLARDADFFDFDSDDNPTVDFTRSSRACLLKEGSLQQLSTQANHEKLEVLFNVGESYLDFPSECFSKMKKIVVLHLGNWSSSGDNIIEAEGAALLEGLSDVRLLKYLSLNGISGITELPGFICKPDSDLMILDLKACWNLDKLPNEIGSLTKLTHLDMSGCYLIDSMPKGLASLQDLQVLKGFVIGSPRTKGQCTLSDLEKLEKLRKLGLYANRKTTGEKGELNCLSSFKVLRILTISWTIVSSESKSGKGVVHKILANTKKHNRAVQTHEAPASPKSIESHTIQMYSASPSRTTSVTSLPASLEKVDLRCWPLSRMPNWMQPWKLKSLKKLYITGGSISDLQIPQPEEYDPPLWTVKILRLKFLRELKMDWPALTTMFPTLEYLEKVNCPELLSFPPGKVLRLGEIRSEAGTSR
ncbi:Disease resistance RPP13-like protein 4 [Camellia lanceoleosa]|uniref:Disease resistance RPP13-like protein 4 n=1 Tax=Camellia lanceoleosa TaxID=1840588 RepID=A0ACC0IMC6_9ERIC|nr:Disease resistance RPP13-like protein 4 [Camellia lanceoleosa]